MDLTKIKTYSLAGRRSKVAVGDLARVKGASAAFAAFYNSLPNILAAADFKAVVKAIVAARKKKRPVIFMLGAHIIKCGLNPLLIDLMRRGVITAVALNGAGLIHDFELAFCGKTSEDVASALDKGMFGMSRDTAEFVNRAISQGDKQGWGAAEALARKMRGARLRFAKHSLLVNARRCDVPVTAHIALGADIVHQHPSADGAAMGSCSLRDFYRLSETVARLGEGGVAVNFGSAVVLPEVFLKALNLARNLGHKVKDFTTVTFDMIKQYRPQQNVVCRPLSGPRARGYYIIGHHELMLPLLYWGIVNSG
ncbi:MAG: hypothetical protein ACE5GG_04825 [Candidatus Omnitrophota bacterium]